MDAPDQSPARRDAWSHLARFTRARIALGRTGGSQPTKAVLEFRQAHARARDAVHAPFAPGATEAALRAAGFETFRVTTGATDRTAFLVRPDLGRRLSDESRAELAGAVCAWGSRDLVVILSDGLSALAVERHAVPTLTALVERLRSAGWSMHPVIVAPFGRVKLQDEIGELLGARHALMLLGERPGLGSPDSLGAYFTFAPRAACTDADRNCISNIRGEGLAPGRAADKIAQLLIESAHAGVSGVRLKDTGDALGGGAGALDV